MLLAARGANASDLKLAQEARKFAKQACMAKPVRAQPLDEFLETLQTHMTKQKQPKTSLFGGGKQPKAKPAPGDDDGDSASSSEVTELLGVAPAAAAAPAAAPAAAAARDPRLAAPAPAPEPTRWAVDATPQPQPQLKQRVDELFARQARDHSYFTDNHHQTRRRVEDLERRMEGLYMSQQQQQTTNRSLPANAMAAFQAELLALKRRLSALEGDLRVEINKTRSALENRVGCIEGKNEQTRRKSELNAQQVSEAKEKLRQSIAQMEGERRERGKQIEGEVASQLQGAIMRNATKLLAAEVDRRLEAARRDVDRPPPASPPAPATPPAAPAPPPAKKRPRMARSDLMMPSDDEDDKLEPGELKR